MPFNAECPLCHILVQNVPDLQAGHNLDCPRCLCSFTLVATQRKPKQSRHLDHAFESATAPLLEDYFGLRKRSPAPTDAAPEDAPLPSGSLAAAVGLSEEELPPPEPDDRPAPADSRRPGALGVGSFLLGSLALLSASLTHLGGLTFPLAGMGVALGVLGGLVGRGGRLLPGLGGAVSLATLSLAVCWPGWIGNVPHGHTDDSVDPGIQQVIAPGHARVSRSRSADAADEWVDARNAVQQGAVWLRVMAVEFPEPGADLVIRLRIRNLGAEGKIEYSSWSVPAAGAEDTSPRLSDERGRAYRRRLPGPTATGTGHLARASIRPARYLDEVLVFEAPAEMPDALHLELPAAAVGAAGQFRLAIPKVMIADR